MSRVSLAALAALVIILATAAAIPFLPLPDPVRMAIQARFAISSAGHWLGQDQYGRDILTRLLWGVRVSLLIALSSTFVAAVLGVVLGLIGGYFRGACEILAVRSMEIILCFPPILLALMLIALFGPGISTLIPVMAVLYLPNFVRVTYAGVLLTRNRDYVVAMQVLGASPLRIMLGTILPNISGPILVQFSLTAASAVMLEAGLSFLGLGVVPPAPSLGLMIGEAKANMAVAPQLLLWPSLMLFLLILSLNGVCEWLADLFDPQTVARRPTLLRPMRSAVNTAQSEGSVLDIRNLTISSPGSNGPMEIVRNVSFSLTANETLALVGESGSGKSLTGLAIMGLLPENLVISKGGIVVDGQPVLDLEAEPLRRMQGRTMSVIFQDSLSSLNPVQRVGPQVAEAISEHASMSAADTSGKVIQLFKSVGIPDPAVRFSAFPHEMSGGMRQRAMIAMGCANAPRLLIADECTTALDVTIQAQVIDLLAQQTRENGMGLLFVSHNLAVVAEVADKIAVMYAGEIVEYGPAEEIIHRPAHPYTQALLGSVPKRGSGIPEGIGGSMPSPNARPAGCAFRPRCPRAVAACAEAHPQMRALAGRHEARCIRLDETVGTPELKLGKEEKI
jgi:peptide/nickel transport system permease protein